MAGPESDAPGLARPELVRVLESAARLQEVVPDAVLVAAPPQHCGPTTAPPLTTIMCCRISATVSMRCLKRSKPQTDG